MVCVYCGSKAATERREVTSRGYRRFRCRDCGRQFNERGNGVMNRTCLPSDIIAFVVFCRLQYRLEALREEMRAEICQKGFSERRNTFVSQYHSQQIDASLLLIPLVGFLPIDDPRIKGTIAAVEADLMEGGLVRRHKASAFGTEEGVFIPCSCWLADCMNLQGRKDEARALLSRVIALTNDVGLLSEEYHVPQERLVGNFPRALSHLALVNSGLGLSGRVLQRGGG